jgi:hypothetical protein
LFEFIYQTPAAGLTGAAVKLRLPTDVHRAIEHCQDAVEGEALRNILRVVERELPGFQCLSRSGCGAKPAGGR